MSILGLYEYLTGKICSVVLDHKTCRLIYSEDDKNATEFDISTISPIDKLIMKSFIGFLYE